MGSLSAAAKSHVYFNKQRKKKVHQQKTRPSTYVGRGLTLQVEFGFSQFDVGVVFIPREPSAAAGRRQVDVAVPVITVVVPEATTAVLGAVDFARRIVVSVMRAERFAVEMTEVVVRRHVALPAECYFVVVAFRLNDHFVIRSCI